MSTNWVMRPYQDGDEAAISELYQLVFGEELDIPRWKWRYKENPVGLITIVLAEDKSGLVGQYALHPIRMKIGNSTRIAALSLDTMVHPDYRGQGMFIKLARHLYESVVRQGIPLIYGFPNEASHRGFVARLGWVDLCKRVPLFVKPLNMKRILGTKVDNKLFLIVGGRFGQAGLSLLYPTIRSELPDGCTIQQVRSFDERVDRLWEEASSGLNIILVRDRRYLNWRYVEKPRDSYTIFIAERAEGIVGYIVLKSAAKFGLQIGFVVDLLAVPERPDISRCLVSKAVKYFKEVRMDIVSCLMLKHGPYIRALKANGFLSMPTRFYPQEMYLGAHSNTEEYPAEFITDPNYWYITWGDHDDI
jgi:predicted N-acetyltransferase YhbS